MARQAADQYKKTATHDEQAAHLHNVFHLNSSTPPINIDQPARGRDWYKFNLS